MANDFASSIELIAIHIPKTGGRSLNATLKEVYGKDKVFYVKRDVFKNKTPNLVKLIPEGILILQGHFKYLEIRDLHRTFNIPLITWLRDPVERVISNYYFFINRIQQGQRPDKLHRKNETLLEYGRRKGTRNRMTDFLNGIDLNDLFFVGIIEHFEQDLEALGNLLGWGNIAPQHLNRNKEHQSQFAPVSDKIREEITRLNRDDMDLYQKALSIKETDIKKPYSIQKNNI